MPDNCALVADVLAARAPGVGDRSVWTRLRDKYPGLTRNRVRTIWMQNPAANVRTIAEIEPRTAAEYAGRITQCWHRSREAYIEAGRLLCAAKAALKHGEFEKMVETLPFKIRKAEMLMAIYRDQRLVNPQYVALLPSELGTLSEIVRLDDPSFEARIADGTIRPDMERRDIATSVKATVRARREVTLGELQELGNLALPQKRYGVILADPEWRFEPWSRETGMDRAADNHYPTSVMEVIAARPVQSIAAKDCVLFLWATAPMLPHALTVMAAWGFTYKSHIIAVKPRIGTGYWFRSEHELLLLGTCGDVPAPAPGTQWASTREMPMARHSEKPDWQYELIEAYFPSLPKIELNARRGRPGWDSWGLDAPAQAAAAE